MQTIVPQVIGMALFFMLSKLLPKETFGLMGWFTAISYLITVVSSLGLEQIVFRRLAAGGGKSDWAATAFWRHNLLVSLLLLLLLGGAAVFFPSPKTNLLPWFFAAQVMLSLATPFRLLLNARLRYAGYAFATITANVLKLIAVWIVYELGMLTLFTTALIFIGGNALEYLLARIAARQWVVKSFRRKAYPLLVRETLPQYLAVLFDVCLARLDWILLGLMATTTSVAEYSFAYKAYEVEKLPTAMITTLLLPIVSKWSAGNTREVSYEARQAGFRPLLYLIPAVVGGGALLAVLLWKPVVGGLLNSEFGESSFLPLAVLNLSLVFQFATNLLWVQAFSARRYRMVSRITGGTALVNLVLNLVLIPKLGATGAAISLLGSSVFQLIGYGSGLSKGGFSLPVKPMIFVFGWSAVLLMVLLLPGLALPWKIALILLYPLGLFASGTVTPKRLTDLLRFRQA